MQQITTQQTAQVSAVALTYVDSVADDGRSTSKHRMTKLAPHLPNVNIFVRDEPD